MAGSAFCGGHWQWRARAGRLRRGNSADRHLRNGALLRFVGQSSLQDAASVDILDLGYNFENISVVNFVISVLNGRFWLRGVSHAVVHY